jgi:hypothetical protein
MSSLATIESLAIECHVYVFGVATHRVQPEIAYSVTSAYSSSNSKGSKAALSNVAVVYSSVINSVLAELSVIASSGSFSLSILYITLEFSDKKNPSPKPNRI